MHIVAEVCASGCGWLTSEKVPLFALKTTGTDSLLSELIVSALRYN